MTEQNLIPFATIGNLKVMYRTTADFLNDSFTTEVVILNGSDCVYSDLYDTNHIAPCVERALTFLDIYTEKFINSVFTLLDTPYEGIYKAVIPGCEGPDYFKRIDNTNYLKHYTHLPLVWSEKSQKWM